MDMVEAVKTVLSQYATFSGRAARPEYWWWVLAIFLLSIVIQAIDGAVVAPLLGFPRFGVNAGQPLSAVVSLAILVPSIAVGVRRLHDSGRSGWWLLIGLIPVVGWLVLLYWLVQPTENGHNRYG